MEQNTLARARLFCFGPLAVPTVWRQQAAIDNGTSALHASLHGAALRDPQGGENPMMRPNPPQLAACPAPGEMRSSGEQKQNDQKTKSKINFARWSAIPAIGLFTIILPVRGVREER